VKCAKLLRLEDILGFTFCPLFRYRYPDVKGDEEDNDDEDDDEDDDDEGGVK
jgi:hypothetical protein